MVNSVPVFVISVFATTSKQGVTARDRSFMRVLVHQQCIAAKEEILLRQMEFFSNNPRDPYLVVFNYVHGVGNIEVVPSTDVIGAKTLELTNFAWLEERSAERIEPLLFEWSEDHSPALNLRAGTRGISEENREVCGPGGIRSGTMPVQHQERNQTFGQGEKHRSGADSLGRKGLVSSQTNEYKREF
ncbi:hypothetical protein B0H17DRAFT_1141475 [Mycena rosella]|uniref:Uncharacterized protein n=1 Tax=Mycena rosella TaxID=1033263 RepID=A0AAD7D3E7_MYCRO|nr:hypothetical protein B0H17DRAFT_1141475 [Mycena rosella]